MIKLNDYKSEPTFFVGQPECEKVLEYRYNHNGNEHLIMVEIDFENVALITVFELDDNTKKYVTDGGKNLYLEFNKMIITENELINHCNEFLTKNSQTVFV